MSLRLSCILVLAGLPACSDSLSRCEQSVLPTCDPHEADCRRALHEHVGCARGVAVDAEPPEFEFIGESEYLARYSAQPQPADDMARCLRVAGLWPYDPILEGIPASARFDRQFRRVVVADAEDTTAILAAIVQAQRDAELGGFSTWRLEHGQTFDRASALDALFAGEARLYGDIAALKTTPRDDDDFRAYVRNKLDGYEPAESEFFTYARSRRHDYRYVGAHFDAFAASFALAGFLAGDTAELEDAYARPIRTAAELVRGRLTDTPPVEPGAPPLPAGYTGRASDRLGAWMYFTFITRVDPLEAPGPNPWDPQVDGTPQRFADVAGLWAGDRFDCAIDEFGNTLVVWEIAKDPKVEFPPFAITRGTGAHWEYIERDDRLTLVGGNDTDVVIELADSLR
jgi:hypothetical protein